MSPEQRDKLRRLLATEVMGYSGNNTLWRPDEDIVQAVRCLEVFSAKENVSVTLSLGRMWNVRIDGGCRMWGEQMSSSLATAIGHSICEAKGWNLDASEQEGEE